MKKLKDLTLKEVHEICKKNENCKFCPLYTGDETICPIALNGWRRPNKWDMGFLSREIS